MSVVIGPDRPSTDGLNDAMQLPHPGHSYILQHFGGFIVNQRTMPPFADLAIAEPALGRKTPSRR